MKVKAPTQMVDLKKFTHVYPLNDLKPHDITSTTCWCRPSIDTEDQTIIHNSMDGRERYEDKTRKPS